MAVNHVQPSGLRAAQDTSALREVFLSITAESCPQTFNFHMHTLCSDGKLQPEALIQQAIAIGLQGLAITDHHTTDGYQRAQRWLQEWQQWYPFKPAPMLWTGIEVNANLLDTEVHILGYAFNPQHFAMAPYLMKSPSMGADYQAERAIAAIQAAGGLAVLAHPARYRRSLSELIPAAAELGIDGVETYYAYSNPTPWQPTPRQTGEAQSLSQVYNLLNTCGTDTHGMSLLQRL
jgi:predicted metal-dependent phosphoesterase TrpH